MGAEFRPVDPERGGLFVSAAGVDRRGRNTNYTDDLASGAELAATGTPRRLSSVNAGAARRYEFARFILDHAGYKDMLIEPITRADWQRASTPPANAGLYNIAAAAMGVTLRGWHAAVEAFLEREGLLQE